MKNLVLTIGSIILIGYVIVGFIFGPTEKNPAWWAQALFALGCGLYGVVTFGKELFVFTPNVVKTEFKEVEPLPEITNVAQKDLEAINHLSERFSEMGNKPALDLMKNVNSHLFDAHHSKKGT